MNKSLVWFRRDLRLYDHSILHEASARNCSVLPVFIFDVTILNKLPSKDRRVEFIYDTLQEMNATLTSVGAKLLVKIGDPEHIIPSLVQEYNIDTVFASEDYEPGAIKRDQSVHKTLAQNNVRFELLKDQVIFSPKEVLKDNGTPYSVFTPYKNAWLLKLKKEDLHERIVDLENITWIKHQNNFPSLQQLGFERHNNTAIGLKAGTSAGKALLHDFESRIHHYDQTRDFPAIKGPSYLSTHFRFGTVSIRDAMRLATSGVTSGHQTWTNELIWREFYMMVLFHRPDVVTENFNSRTSDVQWDNPADFIEAWKTGKTGYPIVDAAQRQLLQTGYMHNRLRMISASFLTKHLGVDWRIGEQFFAMHLNDFDLAANNGGWQWAASTGCDAQPYFRVFNPILQSQKFDPKGKFIDRYCPELKNIPLKYKHQPWEASEQILADAGVTLGVDYPKPVVKHNIARMSAIARFK